MSYRERQLPGHWPDAGAAGPHWGRVREKSAVPGIVGTLEFRLPLAGPVRLAEDGTGLVWEVFELLDEWRNPPGEWKLFGPVVPTRWFVLRVRGPLSARPREWRQRVVQVTGYSDRPGWWVVQLGEDAPAPPWLSG